MVSLAHGTALGGVRRIGLWPFRHELSRILGQNRKDEFLKVLIILK